jgi:hypothetical protein
VSWSSDQLFCEWQLAHAAHAVAHLANPYFTTDMNASAGVNLAANVGLIGLGVPLTPVTLLFGSAVTYSVVTTGNLVLTGLAWYWLLARPLRLSRPTAALGGLAGTFAPALVSEGVAGHPHLAVQFLVPLIVWRFVRLGAADARPVRDGAILGALLGLQGLIGEEILLYVALGLPVCALGYAFARPAGIVRVLRGLPVAALVAGAILAAQLAYQFAGPQRYPGAPSDPQLWHADIGTYVGVPDRLLTWLHLAPLAATVGYPGPYLGAPVLLVVLALGWPVRRNPAFVGACLATLEFAVLSLGTGLTWHGRSVGVPGPWRLVARLPVFQWVVPYRLGLLAAPALGVALAVVLDHWYRRAGRRLVPLGALAIAVAVFVALALVPLAPGPPATVALPAIPRFITTGAWRAYVPPGRALVTVPVASVSSFEAMRWSAATADDFAIAGGYFLGPTADGKGTLFGPPPIWTTDMLNAVAAQGTVWPVAPGDRDRFLADLRYWRASVLVLAPYLPHADALRATVEEFLGPPQQVQDVLLWDVRGLTGPG